MFIVFISHIFNPQRIFARGVGLITRPFCTFCGGPGAVAGAAVAGAGGGPDAADTPEAVSPSEADEDEGG